VAKQDLELPRGYDGAIWRHVLRRVGHRREHHHEEPELNLVTAGGGTYLVDGGRYDLSRGSLLWLYPDQDHVLIEETTDFAMWVCVFRPSMLRRLAADGAPSELLAGRPTGAFCHLLDEARFATLDRLLDHAVERAADRPVFNAALAFVALCGWRMHEQADESPPGAEVHPAVERAARLLRDDPSAELEDIARAASLSLSRLSRVFKQQTGVSLLSYRQRQRLRRFVELHGRGRRRNLTEAALAAGFGSYAQFHRVFKQVYGVTPRAFRQRVQGSEPSE
jgi:AraC-like DNA-binding protein